MWDAYAKPQLDVASLALTQPFHTGDNIAEYRD